MQSGETDASQAAPEHLRRGRELYRAGQLAEAAQALTQALAADAGLAEGFHLLGLIAYDMRQPQPACDLVSQALVLQPDNAAALVDRARMRVALGQAEAALEDADQALALRPEDAGALTIRGEALAALRRFEAAIGAFRAATAREPVRAAAHRGLGSALYSDGQFEAALSSYDRALEIEPSSPVAHYNRANLLKLLDRFDEALAAYDTSIALAPNFAVAQHNRALCLLHMGRLAEGFAAYEWRKSCPSFDDPRYALDRALAPGEDLSGRTLFVYPEFYQGDLIQFCRYARMAERRGAHVVLAAPPSMHRLLRSLSPTLDLVAAEAIPERFDRQAALLSLPHLLGTTLEDLPGEPAYLSPEPERVAQWRARIGTEGFKIGVVWQGSTLPYALPLQRSYPLARLEGIGRLPRVRLISLQKVNGLEQLDTLPPGMCVETLGADFDAGPDLFLDTAAAMTCCDLLIVMDTSVAHLAGALGCRAWVALPQIADWRWMLDRSDCPWHPSLRLFRQRLRGDWDSVFVEMEAALRAELGLAPQA